MSEVAFARSWHHFYARGVPHTIDIPDVPVTRLLDDAAEQYGRRTALVYFGREITYARLLKLVDLFADGLAGLGVRRGDRVALILPNCPQFTIAWFAVLRIGAVAVPFNPLYTADEMRHQLHNSGATVAIAFDQSYDRIERIRAETNLRHVVLTSLTEYLPRKLRLAMRLPLRRAREARERLTAEVPPDAPVLSWNDVFEQAIGPRPQTKVDPERANAALLYTGGTTGRPKGAMLTHRNLVANVHQVAAWDPHLVPGKDVAISVLPGFHAYGLVFALTAVLIGATTVQLPTFDLELLFKATKKLRPTIFPGVPPIYSQMLAADRKALRPFKALRSCISGAMRLPAETIDAFKDATGCQLVEGYGLTEASPVVSCNPIGVNARPGTVGIPLPNTDVMIVDEHEGIREVSPGEAGELAVRGPQVFAGYWHEPDDTDNMLHDGWLHTGDIAVMSPDGFLTIIDRKRDVIIASGFSVFPSEIEDVLMELPAVKEAAVVGVPDSYRGETVLACVVLKEGAQITEQEIIEHCQEHLAAYKVPKLVEFRTQLPHNIIGKVLRRLVRDEYTSRAAMAAATDAGPAPFPAPAPADPELGPWQGAEPGPGPETVIGPGPSATPRACPRGMPAPGQRPPAGGAPSAWSACGRGTPPR
ncbi:MAG TPA: AMP-binding protein [Actinocrinis sp.]|uniref:AMP-binding protein n=1 Tax=Actinocrinis sp. TaxID=1920516 RepID=UPI002D4E1FC6|nr:AMP-binding protein [Actinocrinis sp.]HZU54902.1 AMP-binding protein [Actinocrinis sp.]